MKLSELFLNFFGAGKLPRPRIATILLAWGIGIALLLFLGPKSLFTLAFAFFLIGLFESNKLSDDPEKTEKITLDAAVGVWVALSVTAYAPALTPTLPYAVPLALLGALGAFLLFDRWAPSTIGWIRRNLRGGLQVMLDDILAGFAAGLLVLLAFKGIAILLGQ
ncbi:phosphatidylglycerophosphatase A [Nitratifractor sp.]|uniref:phosphatidylglycerophosphatase A n=1 Tax=Nitratifractor sp. TaxID=2268144 RepID=UPI0025E4E66B|nr:phosphatidylglycerophosphatase A [Nitratifractor sp.]